MEKELTHKEISSWIASVREDLVYEPPGLREDMDKACCIIESLQARIELYEKALSTPAKELAELVAEEKGWKIIGRFERGKILCEVILKILNRKAKGE